MTTNPTPDDDLTAVARAMYQHECSMAGVWTPGVPNWEAIEGAERNDWRARARAAMQAMLERGWKKPE